MNRNMQRTKRVENYSEYINHILVNRDIDCDEPWWEKKETKEELQALVDTETFYISSSLDMDIDSEELFLFIGFKMVESGQLLLDSIEKQVTTVTHELEAAKPAANSATEITRKFSGVHMICFVSNMKSRIFLERAFSSVEGKEMKRKIGRLIGSRRGSMNCTYILDNDCKKKEIKLKNVNRFDFIEMPSIVNHINWEKKEPEPGKRKGYVLSIDLFQLVEIYNEVGDRLFKHNVRFGISEQLGVDKAIKETLRSEPEQFWFRNNGITILVERPDFCLNLVGEVLLEHLEEYGDLEFSVINGAQTITTAAEYFYGLEYDENEKKSENGREKQAEMKEQDPSKQQPKNPKAARVLLRIIHIPHNRKVSGDWSESLKEVNEISVALNRQKPIKAEDIVYATPYVEKLVAFLERERGAGMLYFRLVRRGEAIVYDHCMDLVEFARARKACAGKPGDARSKGTNALLSFDGGDSFTPKDGDIFLNQWMDADEEREKELFCKYYGAVDFAVKTARQYEKIIKARPDSQNSLSEQDVVLFNGKWYFTAYMVQLFNGFKGDDYTEFVDCFDRISEHLPKLMELFSNLFPGNYEGLESNVFKTNTLFEQLLEEADHKALVGQINSLLTGNSKELSEKIPAAGPTGEAEAQSDSQITRQDENQSASQSVDQLQISENRSDRIGVKFGDSNIEIVDSVAQAMVRTVQYVLNHYPDYDRIRLVNKFGGWLNDDQSHVSFKKGYFRGKAKTVESKGRTFWVGTSSSSAVKVNQLNDLFRFLGVEHEKIEWFIDGDMFSLYNW